MKKIRSAVSDRAPSSYASGRPLARAALVTDERQRDSLRKIDAAEHSAGRMKRPAAKSMFRGGQ
jgi:hypothetical protein